MCVCVWGGVIYVWGREKGPEGDIGQVEGNTETSLGAESIRRLPPCVVKAW